MKNSLSIGSNFILMLAAVICTMGALISAFSFDTSTFVLFVVWAVAALAISVAFSFWQEKGLLVLLVLAIVLILWRFSDFLEEARWVIFHISSEYNRWLFFPVIFPETEPYNYPLTLFFALAGIMLSFLLSLSICMRRNTPLTILFTAPIVFLTFVIVFNRADTIFLIGLLAVYFTMLISNGLSADNFEHRGSNSFPAFLFTVLLMSITLALAPPGEHDRGDVIRNLDRELRIIASRMGIARVRTGVGWPPLYDGHWGFNTDNVGISEAGTRVVHDVALLEAVTNSPGVFYLRGYSMQYFDGNTWTVNSESAPTAQADPLARGMPALIANFYRHRFPDRAPEAVHMTIYVTGDVTRDVFYTPYFAFPLRHHYSPYSFEFFNIEENVLALHYNLPPEDTNRIDLTDFGRLVSSRETYLQIDDSMAEALRQLAYDNNINLYGSRAEITYQVASFMTSFGHYTLAPFPIPLDEDFVMYFFERSRQGYCIHYATAATMLLRALDIPARFTSGFVLSVFPDEVNQPVVITDRYAHAWVEVFFDNIGWIPVEVTPPATGFGEGDGRPGPGIGPGGLLPHTPLPEGFDLGEPDFFDPFWELYYLLGYDLTPLQPGAQPAQPLSGATLTFRIIWITVLSAAVISSPFVFRVLSLKYRRKQFSPDKGNDSVVFAWRYLLRLRRFRRHDTIPAGIEDIAMKARYSQHSISGDEHSAFMTYVTDFAEKVYVYNSPLKRFWIKHIRGL